jgi:hypothetical protein
MKWSAATDVRKNWGEFIDTVAHQKPQMVKRNRDYFLAIGLNHLRALTEDVRFNVELILEEDGSTTAALVEIDLVTNADTEEAALHLLAEDILEYAEEYFEDFQTMYNAPNRKSHFRHVLAAMIQEDPEKILSMMDIQKAPLV